MSSIDAAPPKTPSRAIGFDLIGPNPFASGSRLSLEEPGDEAPPWATRSKAKLRRRSLFRPEMIQTSDLSMSADNTLPLCSPAAPSAQIPMVRLSDLSPGQRLSLEGIGIRSFYLGISLTLSAVITISTLLFTSSPLWRIPFFIAALSTFHFLEFWTTAKYNTAVANVDSFLLTANWPSYQIAHIAAMLECLVTNQLFPNRAWAPFYTGHILLLLGCLWVTTGQIARSAAMIQAGRSFNHVIQVKKKDDHELVTTGLYSFVRHPSYSGFFFWGIGTQLVLGNPICFVAYTLVLWRFFSTRIKHEEKVLLNHYGEAYKNYKEHVGSGIPLVW